MLIGTGILPPDIDVRTNDSGMFSAKLSEGNYLARADAQGYVGVYWNGAPDRTGATIIKIAAGDTQTISFSLAAIKKGMLIVHVLDSATGNAIAGARVTAILKARLTGGILDDLFPDYGDQFKDTTNAQGTATFLLQPGRYIVRAEDSGYVAVWFDAMNTLDLAKLVEIAGNDTVSITIKLIARPKPIIVSISGNVSGVDSTASVKPLALARVSISMVRSKSDSDNDRADFDLDFTATTFTDTSGNYSVQLPANHTYIAFAEARGYIGVYFDNKLNPLEADRIKLDTSVAGINFILNHVLPYSSKLAGNVERGPTQATRLLLRASRHSPGMRDISMLSQQR
jgi:hypothetical protein